MFFNSASTSIPPCSLSLVSDKVNVLFALCPFFLSVIPQPHPDPLRHVSPCGQPCGPVFCYWRATAWANYFFGPVHPLHPIFCYFIAVPSPPFHCVLLPEGTRLPYPYFVFILSPSDPDRKGPVSLVGTRPPTFDYSSIFLQKLQLINSI